MTSVFIENRLKSVIVPENISLKCQSDARNLSKTENEKKRIPMVHVFYTETSRVRRCYVDL